MSAPFLIAVDGPAGSGKSSISRAVARQRSYGYLDTGAMYRALTWLALDRGLELDNPQAVMSLFDGLDIRQSLDPDDRTVLADGADVTELIRQPRVSAQVSLLARIPELRQRVNQIFRDLVAGAPYRAVIVEGRDITTVVAPDAPVRILLTASPEVRAARRAAELGEVDGAADVAAALHNRDSADQQVVDFMTPADGVTLVDSTEIDFLQTVDAVAAVIDTFLGANRG